MNPEQMEIRQKVLADFGEFVLRSESLDEVLHEACRLVAKALKADFAKVLEIEEGGEAALVKAGVGWNPGIVGKERLPFSERSSETYALERHEPVVSCNIKDENRFEFADFLIDHGVVSLVNVPIFLPGEKAYGLLQVDSRELREFDDRDTAFLRTYATILGPVIDRMHKVQSLERALKTNGHLLEELQHRVKNQFTIVASLLRMGTRQAKSTETRHELSAVAERVETLRLLNEQLYIAGTVNRLRLRPFIMQLVENLVHLNPPESGEVRLEFAIEELEVSAERAVPLGLILNEFVTNSLKYAFDGRGGVIEVKMESQEDGTMRLRVCDNGKGLPSEPHEPIPGSGTGMRLIGTLARQIDAKPVWSSANPGAVLSLEFNSRN